MLSSGHHYEQLLSDGKRLAAEGRLRESLSKFLEAKKILETPKILSRIQKLKDAIANSPRLDTSSKMSQSSNNDTFRRFETPKEVPRKLYDESKPNEQRSRVLSEIDNIEVIHNSQKSQVPNNPDELSSENFEKFTQLKKSAMELSYDGKYKKALEAFTDALKLCNCPKIQNYIHEMEKMISKHEQKLQRFQHLSDTGKKLASEGRQSESIQKLKDAYAVCPSPKVSKIIKMLEVKSETPAKNSSPDLSNGEFKLPSLIQRNLASGSSNSDDSDFQNVSIPLKKDKDSTKSGDLSSLSPDRLQQYKNLYSKARENAATGNLKLAMDALNKAKTICPTDKVLKRIKDLQEHLKSTSEEPEDADDQMVAVAEGFYVFHEIYKKLYPYQRLGVAWMYELFKKKKGGVLGDDMGLGKTFQVIAFLSGLIDAELSKHILIIMPVSLLTNWENEFQKWCPGISVCLFHGGSKKEKERNVLRVQRKGHVLLTSYGMVLNSFENLSEYEGRQFVWDYVILDEGHKIKNPTKTTKAVHNIPSRNRLVLTGTPIQNNLRELWALYDFAHQGTLLGSMKTFKMQYENPITRAREKDATAGERRLGTEIADNLRKLIEPYFLRRTKAEIWGKPGENANVDVDELEEGMNQLKVSQNKLTTRKNDLIVWTFLSKAQCDIYESFLSSDAVKMTLVSKRSPLVELTTLKKICDHPRLLSRRACGQLGLNGEEESEVDINDEASNASSIENVSDDTLIAESGKMKFLIKLLENLKGSGHRTLVFSLSRKILDMVHRILINKGWKVMRLDGTVVKMEERERRIQLFQSDSSYSVFLLTTQVGGVGITLTAADRVVIYDPSWNPATDAQAVDRVYRIGQKQNVVVYRLITCGTVEEKIYRRQIFKDSITQQVAGTSADPNRYFSKQELRELFTLDNPHHSATQVQLNQLHSNERNSDVSLDEHIAFLHSLNIFGISDHDLMFSKEIVDETEDNDEAAVSHDYIKKQVAVAREMIQNEAFVVEEGMRLTGSYNRPYLENIPTFKNNTEKDLYKPPSIIQNNYPSSLSTKSSDATDRKYSVIDYKGVGDKSRVSEVIDLCDSPQKSRPSKSYELNSPKMSRKSKTYEPLVLEKNKINNYFTTIKREDEKTDIQSYGDGSSPVSHSISPQESSTPKQKNPLHNTDGEFTHSSTAMHARNMSTEQEKSVPVANSFSNADDSVIEQDISVYATPCEKKEFSFEKALASLNNMSTSNTVSTKKKSSESFHSTVQTDDKEDVYIIEDDGSFTSTSKTSLRKSVSKRKSSDNSTSESNDQEDLSDDVSNPLQENSIHVNNTTTSKEDESVLHEDMPENISKLSEANIHISTTSSKQEDSMLNEYLPGEISTASKEGVHVSNDSAVSSKEEYSVFEEEGHNLSIETPEKDESNIHDSTNEVNKNSSKANRSMFVEDMSDHNTTPGSESGESEENKDEVSFKDNADRVENVSRLSEDANITGVISEDVHHQSPFQNINAPSKPEAGFSGTEFKSNISFDLDSSLYDDQPSVNIQPAVIKGSRKSCAIQKSFINYESDSNSSHRTSNPSSANSSEDEIVESDSEFSDNSDLGSPIKEVNSSISFVANSIPNSPYVTKDKNLTVHSPSRRITPLKLRHSFVSPPNSAFALAMATSPIFSAVKNSPVYSPSVSSPPRKMSRATVERSYSEEEDSPIHARKPRNFIVVSDSDEE